MAKIKVSEKTVAQLRKGTMAGNLAKAKNASPEMREALIRFYGAKRVNAAGGATSTTKAPAAAMKAMPVAAKKVPAAAKRAGLSEASKAKVYPGRPGGTAMATTKSGGTRVNKPLINVPAKLGSAQAKLDAKTKANAALYAKQQKAAQDKKKQKNK